MRDVTVQLRHALDITLSSNGDRDDIFSDVGDNVAPNSFEYNLDINIKTTNHA